jgi:hypothetical protein
VIEQSGWQSRAQSGSFSPRGLIRHWDASSPGSHGAIEYMQSNIACNISTCRGNSSHGPSVHVIAAGRAWHAGEGAFGAFPKDQGNTYAIGHEIAHTVDEPWTDAQMNVVTAAEQAILRHLGSDVHTEWCTHSEYAPTRKIDTTEGKYGQDANAERARLAGGTVPPSGGEDDDMPIMLTNPGNNQVALLDGGKMCYISQPTTVGNLQAAGVKGPVFISSSDWPQFTKVFDYQEDETPVTP